jgi:hypothetical protein
MPRANRHYIPGCVWHITHRCHKKEFLLKFARDRRRWLRWFFEAKKRYGLIVLNYTDKIPSFLLPYVKIQETTTYIFRFSLTNFFICVPYSFGNSLSFSNISYEAYCGETPQNVPALLLTGRFFCSVGSPKLNIPQSRNLL